MGVVLRGLWSRTIPRLVVSWHVFQGVVVGLFTMLVQLVRSRCWGGGILLVLVGGCRCLVLGCFAGFWVTGCYRSGVGFSSMLAVYLVCWFTWSFTFPLGPLGWF